MSLTSGRGPLSANRAGVFHPAVPEGLVYVEPFQRRVRAVRAGATVVDSERVVLVHRAGGPPAYAFPAGDVAGVTGEAEPEAPGYVRVRWDAADAWYEEDEQVFLHASNPYHRVEILSTSRRLHVEVDGVVLVDAIAAFAVYETALPPRLYVDPGQARVDLLVPSATTTFCPYKGTASHWSAVIDGVETADVAWSYEQPYTQSQALQGLLSFYEARVTMTTDLPPAVDLRT